MALPTKMKSVNSTAPSKAEIQTVPLPKLGDDRLLVRVTAVGLNPTDWKHLDFTTVFGLRSGCDFSGIVVEIGSKVTKEFKKGDRVAGMTHGSNKSNLDYGAFAEYFAVKGDLAINIPENLIDEEAATLGVGISTVGQGLYQALKLPLPDQPHFASVPLLVYGGSTATGLLGIQFAKLSGCTVVVTCSPPSFDLVKSLGADAAFDYKSPTAAADIKDFTKDTLQHAWDCIGSTESAKLCASAMSNGDGQYALTNQVEDGIIHDINPKITNTPTLAYTIFGESFEKFGVILHFRRTMSLIKTVEAEVNRGGQGLEGALVGLKELKAGKAGGKKLIYRI